MARIHQTRGKDFRTYETTADGIQAEYRIGSHYRSYKIPYESVDFDEIVSGNGPTLSEITLFVSALANIVLGLVLGLFIFGFANWACWVAGILSGLLVVPFLLWARYIFKRRDTKYLEGSEDIFFFYDTPNRAGVDAFIPELKSEKTKYLHKKYLKIDTLLPLEDQKASVDWLYQNDQIDRRVYRVYLEEYEHLRLLRGN